MCVKNIITTTKTFDCAQQRVTAAVSSVRHSRSLTKPLHLLVFSRSAAYDNTSKVGYAQTLGEIQKANIMEKRLTLITEDNFTIYGTLNNSGAASTKLIIFVHGLTGGQNEHHYFNAVPFFTKEGFDTFRFDFYSDENNARQLSDCSITIHAQDLTTVVNYFKDTYDQVFLVGHSLGVPVILRTNLSPITKIVLWDPTSGMKSLEEKNCVYNEKLGKYILNWGLEIIIGQNMIDEWKEASNLKVSVEKITKPCKFVFAENGKKYEAWKPYLQFIKVPYESAVVGGASHVFVEEGAEQKLFDETLEWLRV